MKNYKKEINEILFSSLLAYLLSPIIKSNNHQLLIIKIIWFIFIFIFLFASIYYLILNALNYLSYDTITSISTINEDKSQFPVISICNTMREINDTSLVNNLKLVRFDFNSDNLLNEYKSHLELYTDSSYGTCYRFNSGKNMLNQTIPVKFSKSNGYDDGFIFSFYFNTISDYGSLRVYIHNETFKPTTIANKGYTFGSGCYNFYIINRVYDQKLEYPYNNCYKRVDEHAKNKTIIDYIKNKNWSYTQNECYRLCKNLKFIELNPCECYLNDLNVEIRKKCSEKIDCVKNYSSNFDSINQCLNYCPLECDSIKYEITPYLRLINAFNGNITNSLFQFSDTFKTYENVTKTFYSISVYYEDLKYTLISQEPKIELFGLISNIGGTFSLFLGFSFVTLLELFRVIFEIVYVFVKKRRIQETLNNPTLR